MPEAVLLTRGKQESVSIAAAANNDTVVNTGGASTLVIQVEMSAGAGADLGVQVNPVEADNATVAPIAIPPVNTIGPTLASGKAYIYLQYDVGALESVRIRITNNNAGTQTINRMSWRLQ